MSAGASEVGSGRMRVETDIDPEMEARMRQALGDALPGGVVFLGVDPHYALGAERWLDRYAVACRHETGVLPELGARGVRVLCLERELGRDALGGRSTAQLIEHPRVLAFLEERALEWNGLSILMFKPSAQVEAAAAARGWRILGARASLARRMENKIQFFRLLDDLGLAHPPWVELEPGSTSYEEATRQLGPRMVVQGAHGFSGNRTFLVTDEKSYDAASAVLGRRSARASAFIGGAPLTLTGCVLDAENVLVGRLFHQVTGVPECTVFGLGACGNDWSACPPQERLQREGRTIAEAVGLHLGSRGFRGIFGMDFVVTEDGEHVLTIEVNPRIVSSVPMATALEEEAHLVPLLAWHLLATSGAGEALKRWPFLAGARAAWASPPPLRGAQLVLHNLMGGEAVATGATSAGIHRLDQGRIHFVRPALRATECGPDEIMILVPAPGHDLAEAGECGRVQGRQGLLEFPDGLAAGPGALSAEAQKVAKAVYAALSLRAVASHLSEERSDP